jgi:hypothetical protein
VTFLQQRNFVEITPKTCGGIYLAEREIPIFKNPLLEG